MPATKANDRHIHYEVNLRQRYFFRGRFEDEYYLACSGMNGRARSGFMQKGSEADDEAGGLVESEAVSWWSWRPGARPLRAFLFGGFLSLLALFLLVNAVIALIAGALDSGSAPLRVQGTVGGHSRDALGSSQLTIRLTQPGFPASITLMVSRATSTALANGAPVVVDYAPHQRTPVALESNGQRYLLPGTSVSGNLLETLALLLFGLLLLPYPLLLSIWAWRDLRTRQNCQRTGYIAALRAARQSTTRTPGLVPRTTHTWHGIAVQVESASPNLAEPEILTFGVREEIYQVFKRGDHVRVTYSPHLRHLYTVTKI